MMDDGFNDLLIVLAEKLQFWMKTKSLKDII